MFLLLEFSLTLKVEIHTHTHTHTHIIISGINFCFSYSSGFSKGTYISQEST